LFSGPATGRPDDATLQLPAGRFRVIAGLAMALSITHCMDDDVSRWRMMVDDSRCAGPPSCSCVLAGGVVISSPSIIHRGSICMHSIPRMIRGLIDRVATVPTAYVAADRAFAWLVVETKSGGLGHGTRAMIWGYHELGHRCWART